MWISGTPTDLRHGLTRRDWLRVGLGGGLASLLAGSARGQPTTGRPAGFGRARSCILVYLFGGVSQLDVWDLKPAAPDGIRGEFRPRATAVAGIHITEHLPRLAGLMRHLAVVRSLTHGDNNHGSSAHRMLTGHAPRVVGEVVPPAPTDFPHYGSSLTCMRPAPAGLPTFVSLPWTIATSSSVQPGQGAGFLGRGFDPLRLHQALPDVLDFTPDGLRCRPTWTSSGCTSGSSCSASWPAATRWPPTGRGARWTGSTTAALPSLAPAMPSAPSTSPGRRRGCASATA
jgi:hypothetical protein